MELVEVDTQRVYECIREKIITLKLAPGVLINEQQLAQVLDMEITPLREALKLLAHDGLVVVTPRHGLYVADISLSDLEQLSELRLTLESLCARLAAKRASIDDLIVLEALGKEQASTPSQDRRCLLDIDHKFHQGLVQAAKNIYLSRTLDYLFGLSLRLWHMTLAELDFLPTAVAEHLELLAAIKAKNAARAEQIMYNHVKKFYDQVREIIKTKSM